MLATVPQYNWAGGFRPQVIIPTPRLIGFHGFARSGKDTAVKLLQSHYGGVRVAFADPIKDGLRAMLGYNEEHLNGGLKEAVDPLFGKSPRAMMQTLGTEWGRCLIDPDIWLKVAEQRITSGLADGQNVYVSDVRFENEAAMIRRLGGTMFHIRRPSLSHAVGIQGHVSEAQISLAPGDQLVYNAGTLDEFLTALIDAKESSE